MVAGEDERGKLFLARGMDGGKWTQTEDVALIQMKRLGFQDGQIEDRFRSVGLLKSYQNIVSRLTTLRKVGIKGLYAPRNRHRDKE